MVYSGVLEKVAMMISGHKTRSTFNPYSIIIDERILEDAMNKRAMLDFEIGSSLGQIEAKIPVSSKRQKS